MRFGIVLLIIISICACTPNNNNNTSIVPVAPDNLIAVLIDSTQVNLLWSDHADNEEGFKIQRKTDSGSFSDVGSTGQNITTFSDLGLIPNTTYTFRVYAHNSRGNSLQYSNEVVITTIPPVNLSSVAIGSQIWSTKNLDVACYRNGDIIPQVTSSVVWQNLTTGAWCWYNNDSATYAATYGKLYNWYALNDSRGLAPQGWHVPTNSEWDRMTKHLDATVDTTTVGLLGTTVAIQLKNTTGWDAGGNGTNSSGFTALPGGCRYFDGPFSDVGLYGYWWSASESDDSLAWYRYLYYFTGGIFRNFNKKNYGFSVRVVKD
jgi:uncharacterized protein (TIGR02145 family)